jgi:hypothetical protein
MVSMHRSYGDLPGAKFDAFMEMALIVLGAPAGIAWTVECDAA